MRQNLLSIVFGLMLLSLVSIPATLGASGQVVLAEIQKRYETTNDFQASFVQEYIGKVMKSLQRGEGKVYFKKKGMMLWDYRVPNQKLISNGHTLWYYQPEEKQVFVSDISKVIKEKAPLAFLAGEGELTEEFNLIHFSESSSQKDETFILDLAPKEPQPALSKLTLTVNRKTFYVIQADVVDGLGNVTRTRFIDIKTNLNLSSSLFEFSVPPGVEVLKMQ